MPTITGSWGSVYWALTHDGARNADIDIIGHVTHGDIEPTVLLDISAFYVEKGYKITAIRLDDVDWTIQPNFFVELIWEDKDGNHMHLFKITGKGKASYEKIGGRRNHLDGATGNLMIATDGYKGKEQHFFIQMQLVKQCSF